MVKNSIHYSKVEEREKVLKTLALCIEKGFADTMTALTPRPVLSSCIRIEKTSLRAILKASPVAMCAFRIRFQTGMAGNALLLVCPTDMVRLQEVTSGIEAPIDDTLTPEVVEACMQLLSKVMEASNERFTEQYLKATASEPPELINPDGKVGSLTPLADDYEGVLCVTFKIVVEPNLDMRVQMLFQQQLLKSLMNLLPDYRPSPQFQSAAEQRSSGQGKPEEGFETLSGLPESPLRSSRDLGPNNPPKWNIDLLLDVELPIIVCFGSSAMQLKDVLKLGVGSVIELDKAVNDPVTVIVNQKPIAKGEVVMVDGNYGVRVLEVESAADRIRSLG